MTLLRNQNNTLPLSSTAQGRRHRPERRLDDQPARRLERQLAGRLRRRPRLLHGPGQPDPAGHHRAGGRPSRRPQRGLRAGPGDRRGAGRPRTPTSSPSARRPTPRGSATTRRPQLPPDQKALISALEDDRQAGDRRRHRRPSGRPRVRAENAERRAHGLPGQHRGRPGRRRRDLRQGQPERQAARSAGRPTRRRRAGTSTAARRHRWATSRSSSTSCRAPAPGRATPTTRSTRSDSACPTPRSPRATCRSRRTCRRSGTVKATFTVTQHGVAQRDGHRAGVRRPAGQQRRRAAAAAGRLHPGDARRRPVDRP